MKHHEEPWDRWCTFKCTGEMGMDTFGTNLQRRNLWGTYAYIKLQASDWNLITTYP